MKNHQQRLTPWALHVLTHTSMVHASHILYFLNYSSGSRKLALSKLTVHFVPDFICTVINFLHRKFSENGKDGFKLYGPSEAVCWASCI